MAGGFIPAYSPFRSASLVWWPIGTSITQGVLGGYRRWVFPAMQAAGKNPTTVGGLLTADYGGDPLLCGVRHNGNAGSAVAGWLSSYYASYAAGLTATPNLVTIELGANDTDSLANGDLIGGDMVDRAAASFPFANILVLKAINRNGAALTNINTGIAAAVAARKLRGYHVDVVDMMTVIPTVDGTHPTPAGYQLMGDGLIANLSRFL